MQDVFIHIPEYDLNINQAGTVVTRYKENLGTFYSYKIQSSKAGYQQIQAIVNGKRKTFLIHRLVAMAFVGNRGIKCEVNHIDSDKKNNSYTNLEWCTRAENVDHAKKNNLYKVGPGLPKGYKFKQKYKRNR